MHRPSARDLSRRERQIMDILYQAGSGTVSEVREALGPHLSYSGVRALLRTLEQKGHVTHREEGPRYVYEPAVPADTEAQSALRQMLSVFFGGSVERAVKGLLTVGDQKLSEEELERLEKLIRESREEST
jgi:predicted transcriptional regulator